MFQFVDGFVEVLTVELLAHLLAHPAHHLGQALGIVLIDVAESGVVAEALEAAVLGEHLGGAGNQPAEVGPAAMRAGRNIIDGREAAKENRGAFSAVGAAILVDRHRLSLNLAHGRRTIDAERR